MFDWVLNMPLISKTTIQAHLLSNIKYKSIVLVYMAPLVTIFEI